jgi:hypothetical protein
MSSASQIPLRISDIEARQDAVLRQLEELEARIIKVLAENGVAAAAPAPTGPPRLRLVLPLDEPDNSVLPGGGMATV